MRDPAKKSFGTFGLVVIVLIVAIVAGILLTSTDRATKGKAVAQFKDMEPWPPNSGKNPPVRDPPALRIPTPSRKINFITEFSFIPLPDDSNPLNTVCTAIALYVTGKGDCPNGEKGKICSQKTVSESSVVVETSSNLETLNRRCQKALKIKAESIISKLTQACKSQYATATRNLRPAARDSWGCV